MQDRKSRIGQRRFGAPVWIGPLCAAIFFCCLLLSEFLASSAGRRTAQARAEELAGGVFTAIEEITRQVVDATSLLAVVDPDVRCGLLDLDTLHRTQMGSSYIDGIARIRPNFGSVLCSTFGRQAQGVLQSGVPDYFTLAGTAVWRHVHLPWIPGEEFNVLVRDDVAIVLHADIGQQILPTLSDVSLGVFSTKGGPVIFSRGEVSRARLTQMVDEGKRSSFDGERLLAIKISEETDMVAFVDFPSARVKAAVRNSREIFLPLGFVIGLFFATTAFLSLNHFFSMTASLKRALATEEIFMNYQPIVDLRTGKWVGVESLMRWKRGGTLVPPDRFIAAAEEAGIIGAITRRVFALVSWDMAEFLREHEGFHVSLNISAEDLQSTETVELIQGMLMLTGLPPSSFWIEVTESAFVDGGRDKDIVEKIRALGVKVAVDDFGTGYSSLSQLARLKVDVLKIDKSFVSSVTNEGPGRQVAVAIIALAKSLNLKLVAEGVETQDQADWLRQQGVDYAQGWLYAKAGTVSELTVEQANGATE